MVSRETFSKSFILPSSATFGLDNTSNIPPPYFRRHGALQGTQQPIVLLTRPHRDPEKPPVQTNEIAAVADQEPPLQQFLLQRSGCHAARNLQQQVVGRSGEESQSRQRPQPRPEPLPLGIDKLPRPAAVLPVRQRGQPCRLRQLPHVPGGEELLQPHDQRR